MKKSDETRARILAAALDLFHSQGFEATTMRQVAAAAGMAIGATYYYFDSKDAIVLAYYHQAQQDMEPLLDRALAETKDLKERLRRLLDVKLAYFAPSRDLLGALSAHANPAHPLSPFSAQTRDIRDEDVRFFDRALSESRTAVADDLKPYLPRLLWMYQMGLILFWTFDRSPGQRKTLALIDQSLQIVVRLIKLSGLPLMRPLRRIVVDLAATVME